MDAIPDGERDVIIENNRKLLLEKVWNEHGPPVSRVITHDVHLYSYTQTDLFVERITSKEMKKLMPRDIRALCHYTAEAARRYTPDNVSSLVGKSNLM